MVQSLNMYNDQFETCALCFKIYFCENWCVNPFKKKSEPVFEHEYLCVNTD